MNTDYEKSDSREERTEELLTYGGHLEVLRRMLFRILSVVVILGGIIFCFKRQTFIILLAPDRTDFITFRAIESLINSFGTDFHFSPHEVPLISTELSSQFMTHVTVSCIVAFLLASPYILYELFRFMSPALYESERKYSVRIAVIIYLLFIIGLLMSYFIIFPISFQFLATYQVDETVANIITLDSYITTFTTLSFMIGVVFQLPIFAYVFAKMKFLDARILIKYRPYALIIILIIAAIITPPDIFTLLIVSFPMYMLYELSIVVVKLVRKRNLQ